MDAVEYVVQKLRLCKDRGCSSCVIEEECRVDKADRLNAERMVEKVEQWAKEHPVKTRKSEFLKMFPDAYIDDTGVIHICPNAIDTTTKCPIRDKVNCNDCRRNYWLQEITE